MTDDTINKVKSLVKQINKLESSFVECVIPTDEEPPLSADEYKFRLERMQMERELLEWKIVNVVLDELKQPMEE